MRHSLVLVLTVLCAIALAQPDTTTTNSIGSGLAAFRQTFTRTTFQARTLQPVFDPANGDYWQSMGIMMVFGGVCTILAILANIFVPILLGLGLFGGAEPMDGFFRGPPRKRPYPSAHRAILVALFFVFVAIVTTIVAFGYLSNTVFDSYFELSRSTVRDTRDGLYTKTVSMRDEFVKLQSLQGTQAKAILPTVISTLDTLVTTQATARNNTILRDVGRVNKVRTYLLDFIYALILLPPIMGFIGGLFLWKDCAGYSLSILWYMLVITWLAFTVHLPMSVMSGDVCNEITAYMKYGNSTNMTTVPTVDGTGIIQTLGNQAQQLIVSYLDIVKHCTSNDTSGAFVPGIPYNSTDVDTQVSYINQQLTQYDPNHLSYGFDYTTLNLTLSLTFVANNATVKAAIVQQINITDSLYSIAILLPTQNNCSSVGTAYNSVMSMYCTKAQYALDMMWLVFLLLALVQVPLIVIAQLAYKRYRKKKYVIPKVKDVKDGVYVEMLNTV